MRIIFSLLLCLGLAGCVSMQSKIMSLQEGTPKDIVIKNLGKPSNEELVGFDLTRLEYNEGFLSNYPQYWLYFNDDKYVFGRLHTMYGIYDQINDLHQLGLISDESYQSDIDDLRQRALRAYILFHQFYHPVPIQFYAQPAYRSIVIPPSNSYNSYSQSLPNVSLPKVETNPISSLPGASIGGEWNHPTYAPLGLPQTEQTQGQNAGDYQGYGINAGGSLEVRSYAPMFQETQRQSEETQEDTQSQSYSSPISAIAATTQGDAQSQSYSRSIAAFAAMTQGDAQGQSDSGQY